jgi:S-formylglutathione hydrolase FrmB
MTIGTMRMKSAALARPVPYTIILPNPDDAGPGPYHVIAQLHGYWDDHQAWIYKSNIARYLERLPLIMVFPNGENGYYVNGEPHRRYEDMIVQDLWEHVNRTYPVRPDTPWAIGGLSMGGYGALRLGLKYPEQFASIFAHSSFIPGPTEFAEWAAAAADNSWLQQVVRLNAAGDLDCQHWAGQAAQGTLPRLSFDCGTADQLLDQNRRFQDYLTAQAIPHSYAEHPGGHTWQYWDRHVRAALRQHAAVFGVAPYPAAAPADAEE